MSKKHEVNIKKSKWINFQLALIGILSFSWFMYGVMNYNEPLKEGKTAYKFIEDDLTDEPMGAVEVIPNNPMQRPVRKTPINIIKVEAEAKTISKVTPVESTIEPVDKPVKEITTESVTQPTATTTNTSSEKAKITTNNSNKGTSTEKKIGKHTALTVEFLPVFPGCSKYSTNKEIAKCFEKKVKRHVQRKFNDGLGERLGLSGKQTIILYFEINENGRVSNVTANSVGKIAGLEAEARRVARSLPIMTPARAGNRKVKMSYTMPISFVVQ